ncbi:MAG TPA: VOC family protein [Candidatus Sulfotelmatobacter sp.]|nr:VOC family protein [Candidatus Sulfotelmatobacter sp.]
MTVLAAVARDIGLRFHHFGLAVREPASAFRYLAVLGYREGAAAFDPLQRVNVAMRHHADMPDVEVIWPGAGPSPIDNMLRRDGALIYHLCYVAADAERALAGLAAAGLDVLTIGVAQPAVLFGGRQVSFHSIDQVCLIELIHGDVPPGERTSR